MPLLETRGSSSALAFGFSSFKGAVPLNATVTVNGAGGSGGGGGTGGNGGRVSGNLLINGTYALLVGGGGTWMNAGAGTGSRPLGGGGLAGTQGYGGQGGGYSGIFLNSVSFSNALAVAGGGGGGAWEGAAGGAGGGTTGGTGGSGAQAGGTGGTQSSAGSGSSSNGGLVAAGQLLGGDCGTSGDAGGGGGGGGGYYGGGSGNGHNPGAAGGGGSSFYNTSYITNGSTTSGAGSTGGGGSNNGSAGSIVISYPASIPDLNIGAGLTHQYLNSGGTKTYTFTAGTGTITYTSVPVDGLTAASAAPSGKYLYDTLGIRTNGVYWLNPTGAYPFQAYVINNRDGGGWVKFIQYNNNVNLGGEGETNPGGSWTTSEIGLSAGKLRNQDINALITGSNFLFRVNGSSDSLLNYGAGTGKFEYATTLPSWGSLTDPTQAYTWRVDMNSNGTYTTSQSYTSDTRGLCGHSSSDWKWISDHNYTGSPICWGFYPNYMGTNLHFMGGGSNPNSGGELLWGGSSSTAAAVFVR